MLRVRQDLLPPPPAPLSEAAVDLLFDRLRKEWCLPAAPKQPDVVPHEWGKFAKGAGAVAVPF